MLFRHRPDLGKDAVLLEDPAAQKLLRRRRQEVHQAWRDRDEALGDDYPSIADFYRGRHVFVTGATGFIGKVIVEKLLRVCPDIGNLYLLIRPRKGQSPDARLKDILTLPVFDRLRSEDPAALDKVVAVSGDCIYEGLGLDPRDREVLADRVSVIFHSAASVRFTDPLKKAVALNTRSTNDVVELAREMKNLKVLVHVSTAYCSTAHRPTAERTYPTDHYWRDVIDYSNLVDADALDFLGPKLMGYQPNSYVFTKALAEQVMQEASRDLPIVITRPSIVTCALKEPVPGWMDNLNGFAMFWAIVSKGVMRVSYSPNPAVNNFDLVPVDWSSNACIMAAWAKGTGQPLYQHPGSADVVNITVGDVKPSTYYMMETVLTHHAYHKQVAYPGAIRYPVYYTISSKFLFNILLFFYHIVFGFIVDTILVLFKKKPMLMSVYRKTEFAFAAISYFRQHEFIFEADNLWRLVGLLHPRDREDFDFNVDGKLESWLDISKDQLLGVLQYALKEPIKGQEDIDKAYHHINRLWWLEFAWYVFLLGATAWLLYWRWG